MGSRACGYQEDKEEGGRDRRRRKNELRGRGRGRGEGGP
jgi:hypothetical protein